MTDKNTDEFVKLAAETGCIMVASDVYNALLVHKTIHKEYSPLFGIKIIENEFLSPGTVMAYKEPVKPDDNNVLPIVSLGFMNERRAALIRKDLDEGLTHEEREEYETLQGISLAIGTLAHPYPTPDFEALAKVKEELINAPKRG